MKRFQATTCGWRVGVAVGLLAAAFALPALGDEGPQANSKNQNLTATAQYSASSEWEDGNPTYLASKAFDGDETTTRWNVASGDNDGSWLAATWASPVTINKVVMYEAFDRLNGFRIQNLDSGGNWVDAYVAEDAGYAAVKSKDPAKQTNPVFTIRFATPLQTKGVRALYTQTNNAPSIFEVEAWNNPSGTLTGTVTDSSGTPVSGVAISAGADSTVSDANGKYTLTTDAGTYNVTASKFGVYRDRIARSVVLTANNSTTHDFVLTPLPPNLSLTATAVSSSDYSGGNTPDDYNAAKANDGNPTTRWNTDSGDTDGAFLEMQWTAPQTFNKVTIREAIDRIRNYSLQTYDEANAKYVDIPGASNINVPANSANANPILTNAFATPITSKRLRLLINHADDLPSVWEMEVSNAPLGTASIVVTDTATGKPVPNATITSDLGALLGTTDANGALSVLLDADDYVISASADGYFAGAPAAFTINGGDKQQVTLTAPAQGPDIALTAKASASSEDPSYPASLVNDGDLTTNWLSTDPTNIWVALTWAKPTHFTVVQLRGYEPYAYQTSDVEMLDTDGKTWVPLPGTSFAPEFFATAGKPADFFFPDGVTTTAVRFFASSTNSVNLDGGLAEMYVFDSPIPKPAQ
jgi:hypothetical protein